MGSLSVRSAAEGVPQAVCLPGRPYALQALRSALEVGSSPVSGLELFQLAEVAEVSGATLGQGHKGNKSHLSIALRSRMFDYNKQ